MLAGHLALREERNLAGCLPSFEVCHTSHALLSLRIRNHFDEEVCESCSRELGIAAAVQISVVDGFAV